MKKALVLDYGNVISEPQDETCYERMAKLSGLSIDFFKTTIWKYRPPFDQGLLSGIEMYRNILQEVGIVSDDLAEKLLTEDLTSWSYVSQSVTDWALDIQKKGHKLGILSNMPHDFLNRYKKNIELFHKADVPIFSCLEQEIKPNLKIYQILISKLGLLPEEIVFFDDIEVNVSAARKAGIQAFLWTGLEQARKDWAQSCQC